MTELDETDHEILQLLMEDARRPYNEIAEKVDLSPPTISDRIERLSDLGIINRLTVDINRSLLTDANPVLVELRAQSGTADEVFDTLSSAADVEHAFRTADSRILFHAHIDQTDVEQFLWDRVDASNVSDFTVRTVTASSWSPQLGMEALSIECTVCGNRVSDEGVSIDIGDGSYRVCCSSCAEKLSDEYESIQQAANESENS
jgi:Lrp/AsnC family leucine-responsive transcriptional regulator